LTAARATLAWALGASAVVHAALAVVPMVSHGDAARAPADPPRVLQAALAPPPDALEILAAATLSPLQLPVLTLQPMQSLALGTPSRPQQAHAAPSRGGPGSGLVTGHVLTAREHLGEMHQRQITEFPVEIGTPVRMGDEIRAPYPVQALREGREDVVTVWAIVTAEGAVEDVQVTQGSEEFSEGVVAAVREARFVPATDRLRPIRYPIALEFRFEAAPRSESLTAQAN